MVSFFRRWGWRHLFGTWIVYWIGLAAVKLLEPIRVAQRLSRLGDDQATISVELENAVFSASMGAQGVTLWSATASLFEIGLWIAGPPLLLWALWAVGRTRPAAGSRDYSLGDAAADRQELRDGVAIGDVLPVRRETVGDESPRVRR